MSRSLNKAQIIGNLGSDPEVRSTSSGTRVVTLSVATSRRWKDRSGQDQGRTEWHRIVAWEGLAEVCEKYLRRGDRVYVEGRIEYRSWEGDDGRTRYTTEIRAQELIMLGGRGDSAPAGGSDRSRTTFEDHEEDVDFSEKALLGNDDDLPF